MVVADFDIVGIAIQKSKADPPLVVDGNRVLTDAVTSERMQSVTRGNSEVTQSRRRIDLFEFSKAPPHNVRREPACLTSYKQIMRALIRKGLDHEIKCKTSRDACQARRYGLLNSPR